MRTLLTLSIALLLATPAVASSSAVPGAEPPGGTKDSATQAPAPAQSAASTPPDLSKDPTLYCVGYAHLDTEWRWAFPQVIGEFLPKTLHDNFALFEKYPDYVFNFTGANRYMLMKEYYPEDYAKLKQYVAQGRWVPNGSSMEEGDVNVPSAESLIRQVLYGNRFFEHEFGKSSTDFMLPDCFGFPASFPSILAHCGIKGFSTQKLSWGSAVGIPFNVGVWEGPDGRSVIAALNPGAYVGEIKEDLSQSADWKKRIDANGAKSGVFADYHYFGTGDTGGAPTVSSVDWLEKSLHGTGPVHVVTGAADQLFKDITPAQEQGLPRYKGDLLLTQHSAGSITSQSYMKRWNRENELLADAAEKAAVTAEWLGGPAYPQAKLNEAWRLTLGSQFHDQLPGTASPLALEYAHNNEALAMNMFADVLTTSVGAVASGLDTSGEGVPVVVYNPLSRYCVDEVVEATVQFPGTAIPQGVRVIGLGGQEVPAQMESQLDHSVKLLFLAKVQSVGFAVYHVVPLTAAATATNTLSVTASGLENERYRVTLNPTGDVASIYDKNARRELLSAPARLAFTHDQPGYWPAWNMDWEQASQPPVSYVDGPATIRIAENGPVRVTLEVTRSAMGSRFVQRISLTAGGQRVEFRNHINWRSQAVNLKAVFPLTVSNPQATYNWELGTIKRGNDNPKQYEVPSHEWFDLTDRQGDYGVTVLCPFKYGSDKPGDNTLRLTLLRTPGPILDKAGKVDNAYMDQTWQDWGINDITYGLAGHSGSASSKNEAEGLEQPLMAFQCPAHPSPQGHLLSMLPFTNGYPVTVLAFKKAEDTDEIVVRLVNPSQESKQQVNIDLAGEMQSAREIDGQEHTIGAVTINRGGLTEDFGPFQVRSFAIKLAAPKTPLAASQWQPVALPYNASVSTTHGEAASGGFDSDGRCLDADMLPHELDDAGVNFRFAPAGGGQQDAVTCKGQTISLGPSGEGDKRYKVELNNALIRLQSNFDRDGQISDKTMQELDRLVDKYAQGFGQRASYSDMKQARDAIKEAETGDPSSKWRLYQQALALKSDAEQSLTTEILSQPIGGTFNRLYFIAAASPDATAEFKFDTGAPQTLTIQDWGGFIGQPDTRQWDAEIPDTVFGWPYPLTGLAPGYMKRAPVAWYASHRHDPYGQNEIYGFSYLYRYSLDIPAGATTLTLPTNPNIHILAMTAASDLAAGCRPAQPLYDTLEGHTAEEMRLDLPQPAPVSKFP